MLAPAAEAARTSARPNPAMPLSVRGLTVAYGDLEVLRDVSVDTPPGSMTAIVGPNGAGKSTLLKAALDLVPRKAGEATFFGRRFAEVRRRVAFVPQRAAVDWDFPATAIDVVLMGLYADLGLFRLPGRRHRDRALAALERVGMADLAHRQIGRLSGGQQQRVFLARALVQDADLTLLDEPFAGVDAATERAIVAVLKTLNDGGRTVVAVHHDLSTVEAYFDRVVLLAGRVVAAGPTGAVFTEAALDETYGGRLTVRGERLPDAAAGR